MDSLDSSKATALLNTYAIKQHVSCSAKHVVTADIIYKAKLGNLEDFLDSACHYCPQIKFFLKSRLLGTVFG
jgi:hypothetical protein